MSIKIIKEKHLTWINISKIDEKTITYLHDNYQFHHLDLEDIQSESQTPKIDVYKNYLFLVLHFPQWKNNNKKIITHEVDIFVGDNYLITVQHGKNKEIKNFFYKCMNNRKLKNNWMSKNSGFLLYKLLEALFAQSRPILNNIGRQIAGIENEIFAGAQDIHIIKLLAIHRRNILHLRRIIDPQKYLIANLSNIRKSFLDESLMLYFDNVRDFLDKMWSIIETYRDSIDGLHLTVESLINQRTNKVIGMLTVISVALMPLTLLSGIYGMNIANLPYAHQPQYVWLIFIILSILILVIIYIMKKRRWF